MKYSIFALVMFSLVFSIHSVRAEHAGTDSETPERPVVEGLNYLPIDPNAVIVPCTDSSNQPKSCRKVKDESGKEILEFIIIRHDNGLLMVMRNGAPYLIQEQALYDKLDKWRTIIDKLDVKQKPLVQKFLDRKYFKTGLTEKELLSKMDGLKLGESFETHDSFKITRENKDKFNICMGDRCFPPMAQQALLAKLEGLRTADKEKRQKAAEETKASPLPHGGTRSATPTHAVDRSATPTRAVDRSATPPQTITRNATPPQPSPANRPNPVAPQPTRYPKEVTYWDENAQEHTLRSMLIDLNARVEKNKSEGITTHVLYSSHNCGACPQGKINFRSQAQNNTDPKAEYIILDFTWRHSLSGIPYYPFPTFYSPTPKAP